MPPQDGHLGGALWPWIHYIWEGRGLSTDYIDRILQLHNTSVQLLRITNSGGDVLDNQVQRS